MIHNLATRELTVIPNYQKFNVFRSKCKQFSYKTFAFTNYSNCMDFIHFVVYTVI